MSAESIRIPAAWLRPLPAGYQIPLWRWLLLPATALMLKKSGGVWINGDLELTRAEVRFTQTKAVKLSNAPVESWALALDDIANVAVSKGLASETLLIEHAGGTEKLLTARSDAFVGRLRSATGQG